MITKIESTIGQATTVAQVSVASFTLKTNIVDDHKRIVVSDVVTVSEDGYWQDSFCGDYTSENQPRENSETKKEILDIIEKLCPWYAKVVETEKQRVVSRKVVKQFEEVFSDV